MFSILGTEPDYDDPWEEQAACREHDSSLFLLCTDADVNTRNFEQAEIICASCPVLTECWQAATLTDKKVTMRAGAWPTEYVEPMFGDGPQCSKGHGLRLEQSKTSDGRCRRCKANEKRSGRPSRAKSAE